MNLDVRALGDPTLRPERFFVGQTSGFGLVRNPFGKVMRRYAVTTRGSSGNAYGALQVDQTLYFDNGEIEAFNWLITEAVGDRYVFAEPRLGTGLFAELRDQDFVYAFRTRLPPPWTRLRLPLRFAGRMSLVAQETVISNIWVSMLGIPFATFTAFHRHTTP